MTALPRITVVTPCFNQAAYVEETIDSVLGQNYPNLEYIVMDGGSTDGSAEIIRRHENHLAYWQSQPDGGQARALVEGFRRATGDILAWLNSDDFYFPGALRHVAACLDPGGERLLFGNAFHFVEGSSKGIPSDIPAKHAGRRLDLIDYLVQPSTFWTRRLAEKVGELDADLHYAFDWEWFIRAQKASAEFVPSTKYLAAYRLYPGQKTACGGEKRFQEIRDIYARHHSPEVLAVVDFCHANYGHLNRWRRRFQRWPFSRRNRPERLLRHFPGSPLKAVSPEALRDILDMIAG